MWIGYSVVMVVACRCAAAGETDAKTLWLDPVFQRQFMGSYGVRAEIEPRVTVVEKEQMEKILVLLGADEGLDKARVLLEKTVVQPAASAVFDFTLANVLLQQEKYDAAAESYLKAIEKFPSFQRAYKNLGLVRIRGTNGMEQAIQPLTRAIELGANDGLTYGLLAHAYASTEQFVSAESAYRLAMMLQPATVDWKLGLARCLFRQQKFEEAAMMCAELMSKEPQRVDYWLLQANAYVGLKQPLKAAEVYEYLDLSGRAPAAALNTLGDIYVNEGFMDLAADAYLRGLARDAAAKADRHIRNAEVLGQRGASAEAVRILEAVRQLFGQRLSTDERKRVLKLEARIAAAVGRAGAEQVKLLEEIVALDPLDGEALILLGQYYATAGNIEKACFNFETAAGIEKFEAEAKLRHGQCLVRNARYQEAIPLLKRTQELKPREDVGRYLEQVERVARTRN
jgi:tetratricopeptide (TPR) repeat protein